MKNVLTVLDPDGSRFGTTISTSDFPKGHLRKKGKEVTEITKDLKRAVLIDDKRRYLDGSPENGILCPPYRGGRSDKQLFGLFWTLLLCYLTDDVRSKLRPEPPQAPEGGPRRKK